VELNRYDTILTRTGGQANALSRNAIANASASLIGPEAARPRRDWLRGAFFVSRPREHQAHVFDDEYRCRRSPSEVHTERLTDKMRMHDFITATTTCRTDPPLVVAQREPVQAAVRQGRRRRAYRRVAISEPNELYILDRRETHRITGSICAPIAFARTATICSQPSVVLASERMDDDPRWQLLAPGKLVHVYPALQITSDVVLPDPPRHQLRPADLNAIAQAAQHTAAM
jgi:hypothetical protein